MSSKNPSSDPLEPEGTGVPADDAAEHATSGSSSTDSAAGAAEPSDAGQSADKVSGASADSDATAKIDRPGSAGSGEKEPADTDESVVLGKESPVGEETVALGKSASEKPTGPESDETGKLERSGAATTKSFGLRSRFPLPVLATAAVLLIAAVVAVGVFFYLANDRQGELDRRAAATKAACDFGNSFATYTGDKADDYISRLDQNATGEWKKLVSQIGPDLKARFAETQVNSTAAEVQCGYESGEGDKARVVLVIDQQFTTAGGPQQQAPGRVKVAANVDMEKVDGRWMVANFDTPMMQQ